MANVAYLNNTTPVAGLSFNPGLHEVLDANGTLGALSANLFEIINNDPGPFNGFKVQFTSNVSGGVGDFKYLFSPNAPPKPSGTITGMSVKAPDGTVILVVAAGPTGFGNQSLAQFFDKLTNPNASPADAVANALNSLLSKPNAIGGSATNDHMTAIGTNVATLSGWGGNDVLSSGSAYEAELSGGTGNDLIRVSHGRFAVHGNNDTGGGSGETDTLEVVSTSSGSTYARITKATDIDILRFTDPAASADSSPYISVEFRTDDIGSGHVSPTLQVRGSTTMSPSSENAIKIYNDAPTTKAVNIDLSKWTFTDWNLEQNQVQIWTNSKFNDTVIGSRVNDFIETGAGNDTIRGGGGTDYLNGGAGNDTFVYGANEAVGREFVYGGGGTGETDRLLVLGNNDFTKVEFYSIEQLVFGGKATATFNQYFAGGEGIGTVVGDANANTLAIDMENPATGASAIDLSEISFISWSKDDVVSISGTNGLDSISGSVKDDVINGGTGSDNLQGNAGADTFVFADGFGRGVDHIADFHRREGDMLQFEKADFAKLKVGELSKAAFAKGVEAHDRKDRIIYDKESGVVRYDDDGSGKHKAHIVAVLEDAANLKHGDIFVI